MADQTRYIHYATILVCLFALIIAISTVAHLVSTNDIPLFGQGSLQPSDEITQRDVNEMQSVSRVVTGLVGAAVLIGTGWTLRGITD